MTKSTNEFLMYMEYKALCWRLFRQPLSIPYRKFVKIQEKGKKK